MNWSHNKHLFVIVSIHSLCTRLVSISSFQHFFSYCFSQNIIIFAINISCAHLKIFLKHLKFEGKLKTPRKKFQPLIVIYVYRNYDHGSANSSLKFIEKSKIEIKYWRTISIVDKSFESRSEKDCILYSIIKKKFMVLVEFSWQIEILLKFHYQLYTKCTFFSSIHFPPT